MNTMTAVRKNVETMLNHRLAVMPIFRFGSTSAMASLVTSVRTPSLGLIRTLTPNAAATPA
jgi:hypothetical protein